jgi:hypothetical protein
MTVFGVKEMLCFPSKSVSVSQTSKTLPHSVLYESNPGFAHWNLYIDQASNCEVGRGCDKRECWGPWLLAELMSHRKRNSPCSVPVGCYHVRKAGSCVLTIVRWSAFALFFYESWVHMVCTLMSLNPVLCLAANTNACATSYEGSNTQCCLSDRSMAYGTHRSTALHTRLKYYVHYASSSITVGSTDSPLYPFSFCLVSLLKTIPVLCSKFQPLLCYDDNVDFVIVHSQRSRVMLHSSSIVRKWSVPRN